jgi:glucose-6-phosphate isomerase
MVTFNYSQTQNCVSAAQVGALGAQAMQSMALLHNKNGAGSDFTGWVNLPSSITSTSIDALKQTAQKLCSNAQIIVVAGIGGSYLGARAVIEALSNSFGFLRNDGSAPQIIYAGQNLSEDYAAELSQIIADKSAACIAISKSGTTTEPAIAFRIIKNMLEKKYGKAASQRIAAVTDQRRGALRAMADKEGYQTFVIPDDVGGRFSVLTPVGLLPIACAGIDIAEIVHGAKDAEAAFANTSFENNAAAQYAAVRNALYSKGKKVEILANFNPKLHSFAEWWKQLYGESEGKDGRGIFPASVDFTTDLHSLGQYIQSGERILFETFLSVKEPCAHMEIPADAAGLDGLDYLAGRRIGYVNDKAALGTQMAHAAGGVPIVNIEIPALTAYNIGYLIYFFEKACGISGYMLGVNPFDQPGVEAYKKNMFALLGKQ